MSPSQLSFFYCVNLPVTITSSVPPLLFFKTLPHWKLEGSHTAFCPLNLLSERKAGQREMALPRIPRTGSRCVSKSEQNQLVNYYHSKFLRSTFVYLTQEITSVNSTTIKEGNLVPLTQWSCPLDRQLAV